MSSFKLPLGGPAHNFRQTHIAVPLGGVPNLIPTGVGNCQRSPCVRGLRRLAGWPTARKHHQSLPRKFRTSTRQNRSPWKLSHLSHIIFFYLLATTLRLATCRIMLIMLYLVTVSCQRVPLSSSPLIRNFPWESRCVDAFVIFCAWLEGSHGPGVYRFSHPGLWVQSFLERYSATRLPPEVRRNWKVI